MLIARDIRADQGRAPVLHGVDLLAGPGRLTAIIGPNGSGKTTLLRCLAGELSPRSGTVSLNGEDIAGMAPHALALRRALLPQHSALSFPFLVAEILRIGLTAHRCGPEDQDALIRAALSRVGLPGHAGRLYQHLSGGEQQRVQLARAMVQVWQPVGPDGPRGLLLDEPVSSLDIAHQLAVMRLARGMPGRAAGWSRSCMT